MWRRVWKRKSRQNSWESSGGEWTIICTIWAKSEMTRNLTNWSCSGREEENELWQQWRKGWGRGAGELVLRAKQQKKKNNFVLATMDGCIGKSLVSGACNKDSILKVLFWYILYILAHPISAILNQELATKMLQIQSKRFYLDVKQNKRGKFIKVYSYKYKSFKIQMQTIFKWWPGCRDKCGRPKGPDLHGSLHCRFLRSTKQSFKLNQWEKNLIFCGM